MTIYSLFDLVQVLDFLEQPVMSNFPDSTFIEVRERVIPHRWLMCSLPASVRMHWCSQQADPAPLARNDAYGKPVAPRIVQSQALTPKAVFTPKCTCAAGAC